jgi:hypothetical protein
MTPINRQVRMVRCRAIGLLAALFAGCARSQPAPSPATSSPGPRDGLVGVSPAASRLDTLAAFQPDLPAVDGPFECSSRAAMGPRATSISAAFPTRSDTKATVEVVVDSKDKIIRYAERRGAAALRSTTITLDYDRRWASVANRGGGLPDQAVSGPIDRVASMEKFGMPLDRAARVLAQCDVRR